MGSGDEEREGTRWKCMVISAEEVMESGHFFLQGARPPTSTFTTLQRAHFIPIQVSPVSQKNASWKDARKSHKRPDMALISQKMRCVLAKH